MKIGEAAHASGVSAKMIRYYETIGLIHMAERGPSGYRQYEAADVHRLRVIRIARDSGFSLGGIREILALWDERTRSGADTKALALAKIAELERRVEQIDAMIGTLRQLVVLRQRGRRPSWPTGGDTMTPRKAAKPLR
jgi:DNA-binding transcriptional MerR regulator